MRRPGQKDTDSREANHERTSTYRRRGRHSFRGVRSRGARICRRRQPQGQARRDPSLHVVGERGSDDRLRVPRLLADRRGAAVQGGFDATCGMFYAGVWASGLNFGDWDHASVDYLGNEYAASLELDSYAGVKFTTGRIAWDLGVIYYSYPNKANLASTLSLNYLEFKVAASTEEVGVREPAAQRALAAPLPEAEIDAAAMSGSARLVSRLAGRPLEPGTLEQLATAGARNCAASMPRSRAARRDRTSRAPPSARAAARGRSRHPGRRLRVQRRQALRARLAGAALQHVPRRRRSGGAPRGPSASPKNARHARPGRAAGARGGAAGLREPRGRRCLARDRAKARRARRGTLRIATRKRDLGQINQTEFIDARRTLTDAHLNLNRIRAEFLSRIAELEYAVGDPRAASPGDQP